jgi:recombination protein RecR
MRLCARCGDFTDKEICRLCSDPARDAGVICVVEETQDLAALERSRAFNGLYHVLHGSLAPLDGIGPDRIKAKELVERVRAGGVREIVLATDPDTEGEATALYIAQILKPFPVKVTRIAHGVPLGGDLDYLDERTLSYAMSGRREV